MITSIQACAITLFSVCEVGVLFISLFWTIQSSQSLQASYIVNQEQLRNSESQSHPSELDTSPNMQTNELELLLPASLNTQQYPSARVQEDATVT